MYFKHVGILLGFIETARKISKAELFISYYKYWGYKSKKVKIKIPCLHDRFLTSNWLEHHVSCYWIKTKRQIPSSYSPPTRFCSFTIWMLPLRAWYGFERNMKPFTPFTFTSHSCIPSWSWNNNTLQCVFVERPKHCRNSQSTIPSSSFIHISQNKAER